MKKIVRGNDFTMRVPVRRIVNGEKERFPLPACEEIEVNLVNAFRRRKMEYTIDVEDDSLLEVSVHSSEMALGAYALEVKGKLFGCSWRSNEYEQIMLVDNNASGDTEFGETDEGEDSVEMDTAIVVLAPVIVIDGDVEVLKDEIANGVRDGNWLPVRQGKKSDGTFANGAVEEGTGTASGSLSHAEGNSSIASGNNSHAEGKTTTASGLCSHSEGQECVASGNYSHAEGQKVNAIGEAAHVEGYGTKATGRYSHAEGEGCKAEATNSHAEGLNCNTKDIGSHAEGYYTTAQGYGAHSEGSCNYSNRNFIHTVGVGTNRNDYTGIILESLNAVVVYVGRTNTGFVSTSAPKNGYQYLLDVGGYKGREIGDAKSVQEVFADLTSRIEALEAKLADTTAEEDQQTN